MFLSTLTTSAGFLAFVLLALVGPGLALQRLLRLPADPALVLPLGIACATGGYWLAWSSGLPWLFVAVLLPINLTLLWPPRGAWLASGPPLRGAWPPLLALLALFAATRYPENRPAAGGDFLLDPLVTWDTALHVGLARELTLPAPAQVPMLAGVPLSYHVGADLLRAAALTWARVDPYDSISRYDLTLFALALVMLLRTLTARLGAPPLAVSLAPWALLATDLSFLFGALPRARWWADEFRGNLLLSLVLGNPVVPALLLALGALLALARYDAGEGRGHLALALIQALAVPFFKAFTGGHLALAFGFTVLLAPAARRRALALLTLAPLLTSALMAQSAAGQRVSIALEPLDLVRATREGLGLPALVGAELGAWTVAWLGVSLGVRLLGIGPALRALRSRAPATVAMAALALSAWPLGLLLRVSAEAAPGDPVINNANFFLEQGGLLLWVFSAFALARLSPARRLPALASAALLALPSTAQFAFEKARLTPDRLDAHVVAAMAALERASQPGDVILQRPGSRFPPPPVILIGRRVAYERFSPFLAQFAPPAWLRQRHEDVLRFFRARQPAEALDAARALGARFVCLYGADRVRFEAPLLLEPLYESAEARCYRIRGAAPEARVEPRGLSAGPDAAPRSAIERTSPRDP